jgi:hypothetical protein
LDEAGLDWPGSDEPYWIFNSTYLGEVVVATRSQIFGGVDSNDTWYFPVNEGWLWPANGVTAPLPIETPIGVHIQLWEHDEGDPEEVQQAVKTVFIYAIAILSLLGVTAWVGAVLAAVGAVLYWLMSFLDEDHIADWTVTSDKKVIDYQIDQELASTRRNFFEQVQQFTDGDGDYKLTLRITRLP